MIRAIELDKEYKQNMKEKARRYNKGKLRYELIPNSFKEQLAKVYTMGAEKYTVRDDKGNIVDDGAGNWRKGLSWKDTLGSIYRHLEKFEKGEDFDTDWPQEVLDQFGPSYHLANAAWGLSILTEYYTTHLDRDDRIVYPSKRIGLDIDEVLADWISGWMERWDIKERPNHWNFDRKASERFKHLIDTGEYDSFLLNLKPLIDGRDLKFEPVCYVTARSCNKEIVEKWLDTHNFPVAPVEVVELGGSKVEVLKKHNVDIFIDDNYKNFTEINASGILCYLFDQPYNKKYVVGSKRIYNLNELA